MTTPRKKRPATRSRTAKAPAPKRPPPRRSRAGSSSEGVADDVFVPRRGVNPIGHTIDDEDTAVFVARPGRPITVQTDLEDALPPAGQVQVTVPRTGTASGWTASELREHGLEIVHARNGDVVRCAYRCHGTTSNVPGVSYHDYDCQYWQSPEGRTKTPF